MSESIGLTSVDFLNCGLTDENSKKTRFNQRNKILGFEDMQDIKPRDDLEYFLKQALNDKSFSNTIIIVFGHGFLRLVYKTLLEFNIE